MASLFCCPKTFGLEPYASAFASSGLGVLVFDYRSFGFSDSMRDQPRNLPDPYKHIEDWKQVGGNQQLHAF